MAALRSSLIALLALASFACRNGVRSGSEQASDSLRSIGSIERLSPDIDRLIPPGARIEVLADGFEWAEGPVWISDGGYVLFSDVPRNSIYRWKDGEGSSLWLSPSGYSGGAFEGRESGSNGLLLDPAGRLFALFTGKVDAASIAHDLKLIMDKYD